MTVPTDPCLDHRHHHYYPWLFNSAHLDTHSATVAHAAAHARRKPGAFRSGIHRDQGSSDRRVNYYRGRALLGEL
jgi:hypothetical protein